MTSNFNYDIVAAQAKGPNPAVMERFQSVASQLMSQVRARVGRVVLARRGQGQA